MGSASDQATMHFAAETLEGLGLESVRTYLQSGNVVLSAGIAKGDVVAERVRTTVKERFGVDASALAVDLKTLSAAVDECPMLEFATEPGSEKFLFWYERVDP